MLRIPSWHNHELSLRQNKSRINQAPVTFSRITFSFSGGKLVEVSDQDMKLSNFIELIPNDRLINQHLTYTIEHAQLKSIVN